jgi:hypothetical protein
MVGEAHTAPVHHVGEIEREGEHKRRLFLLRLTYSNLPEDSPTLLRLGPWPGPAHWSLGESSSAFGLSLTVPFGQPAPRFIQFCLRHEDICFIPAVKVNSLLVETYVETYVETCMSLVGGTAIVPLGASLRVESTIDGISILGNTSWYVRVANLYADNTPIEEERTL